MKVSAPHSTSQQTLQSRLLPVGLSSTIPDGHYFHVHTPIVLEKRARSFRACIAYTLLPAAGAVRKIGMSVFHRIASVDQRIFYDGSSTTELIRRTSPFCRGSTPPDSLTLYHPVSVRNTRQLVKLSQAIRPIPTCPYVRHSEETVGATGDISWLPSRVRSGKCDVETGPCWCSRVTGTA